MIMLHFRAPGAVTLLKFHRGLASEKFLLQCPRYHAAKLLLAETFGRFDYNISVSETADRQTDRQWAVALIAHYACPSRMRCAVNTNKNVTIVYMKVR